MASALTRRSPRAPRTRRDDQHALFPTTQITDSFSDRYYQIEAVDKICAGLADGGRGQLTAACGTGKTRMALWASQRLVHHGGVVLIAVPTIGLVAQTLDAWRAELGDALDALAVCGDNSVNEAQPQPGRRRRDTDTEDSLGTVEDILDPVTTDSDVVAEWLRRSSTAAVRLIVGTHASCHVLGAGLQKALTVADILVVDEAHRSAGAAGKHTALLHDDDVIPAHRRLYMTATPRVFKAAASGDSKRDDLAYGMDDLAVFGPVLYNYPFSRAIEDGYLDDYRVAVIGVTKAEVLHALKQAKQRRRDEGAQGVADEHTAMVQAALARAAADLGLRRVIAFCPRIADAHRFASTFASTLEVLPPHLRPDRVLHAIHIHGGMNQAERSKVLSLLAEPPDDGWTVVSNARCLSEGIDIPSVDCIAFTAAKRSPTEIVQAVGRALRRSEDGSGMATILVPVLLPDDHSGADEEIDAGEFEVLWEVVRALRSHDDTFASALDSFRANGFRETRVLDKITFSLPARLQTPQYLEHLTLRLVKSATSRWWDGYSKLVTYFEQHNTFDVQRKHLADGFNLIRWISRTREAYRLASLPRDRVEALTRIGFPLQAIIDPVWRTNIDTLRRFHAEHGHIDVPDTLISERGTNIKLALAGYRRMKRRGTLSEERTAALNELGMDWSSHNEAVRREIIAILREYREQHGHIAVLRGTTTSDGHDVAIWLQTRRNKRRDGQLSEEEIAELDELGMVWNGERTKWERRIAFLRRYKAKHGTINNIALPCGDSESESPPADSGDVPAGEVGDESIDDHHMVRDLIAQYRSLHHRNKLAQFKVDDLDSLGIEWGITFRPWDVHYRRAAQYRQDHGHLNLTEASGAESGPDDVELGQWLDEQRKRQATGGLAQARVEQLEAIGIVWLAESPADRAWFLRLSELDDYCRRTSTEPAKLRQNAEAEDGTRIGAWLSAQRQRWRRGTLEAVRAEALAQRGIIPAAPRPSKPPRPPVREVPTPQELWSQRISLIRAAFEPGVQPDWGSDAVAIANRSLQDLRQQNDAGKLSESQAAELVAILPDWDIAQTRTRRQLIAARRYAAVNGHLDMESTFVDDDGVTLGAWLATQRRQRATGALDERVATRLESLGMDWDPNARQWECGYAAAQKFFTSHGHLRVSKDDLYLTPLGEEVMLRQFLQLQRNRRRAGSLTEARIADLDRIGMSWDPESDLWEEKVSALRTYREAHGNIVVPWDCRVDGIDIGRVVANARRDHAAGQLSQHRFETLDELGMVWDLKEAGRREMIDFLRRFHDEHGHIRVDRSLKAMLSLTDEGKKPKPSGIVVSRWLWEQRIKKDEGRLSAEHIADLDALGMVWERRPQDLARWQRMMSLASAYFAEYGHLVVSASQARADKTAASLYHWFRRIRAAREEGQLDDDRIAALDAIGMQWPKPSYWMTRFNALAEYRRANGRLPAPGETDATDKLLDWLGHQRSLCRNGRQSPERRQMLESIGVRIETVQDQTWFDALARLDDYRHNMGDPHSMPNGHRSPDGFGLYHWYRNTLRLARTGALPAARVRDLLDRGVPIEVATDA